MKRLPIAKLFACLWERVFVDSKTGEIFLNRKHVPNYAERLLVTFHNFSLKFASVSLSLETEVDLKETDQDVACEL